MYCGSQTLVKYSTDARTATAIRCRSWLCPDCQPQRQRQLVKEVLDGAPNTFLTLTIRRTDGEGAADAAKRLVDAWRRARRAWMALHKVKKLPFFAVVEATKMGWPHLHVMLRSVWIDQAWLSAFMAEAINSPVVHIKRIDSRGRAAVYVSKYAGKASHKFGTCKRYWRSMDYLLVKPADEPTLKNTGNGHERWPDSIARVVSDWTTYGWSVTWLSKWRASCVVTPG